MQEEQIPPVPSQIRPSERKKRSRTTHGDEEFLDLLHGVGHEGVGLAGGPENLDEDVQIHVEMGVFGISPLAELLLLERSTAQGPKIYLKGRKISFFFTSFYLFSPLFEALAGSVRGILDTEFDKKKPFTFLVLLLQAAFFLGGILGTEHGWDEFYKKKPSTLLLLDGFFWLNHHF